MNPKVRVLSWLACGSIALSAMAEYTVAWQTVSGGGGSSSGGAFALSGSVGLHDAGGAMTNGPFSLLGGFWVLPRVVLTPGAPVLQVVPAASGFATLSWATKAPGYVLQETLSLTPPNWTPSASGATNPVTVPAIGEMKFYRLFKP